MAFVCLCALAAGGCGSESKTAKSPTTSTTDGETSIQSAVDPWNKARGANGRLRIAAASDLKYALDDLVAAFNRLHPSAQVTTTFGSSGSFFAQLSNQAPFDLFLSADIDYARRLVEQGHGPPGSAFPYARGHIVMWTLKDSPREVDQVGFPLLREKEVKTIAIANPKTAPYGRAAVQALQNLGIYEAVESKLVYGESVAHTAQMVESGAADVGLIALSLAVSPALREKGKFRRVPAEAYAPIIQGGTILSWAEDAALAGEFRDFLLSGEGTAILKEFGFDAPGE